MKFEGEIHRMSVIEASHDFPGGISLILSNEIEDIKAWVPVELAPKVAGLKRLAKISATVRAKEGTYVREGRNVTAYKFTVLDLVAS